MRKSLHTTVALLTILAVGACAAPQASPRTGPLGAGESQAYDAAIGHYERMVAEQPGEIEAVLGLARNLRWAGRIGEAERMLAAGAGRFGGDARYGAELGKVRLIQGDAHTGVALLRDAAQDGATDWRLYSALGIGLDYQQDYGQAEAAYRRALELCPDDAAVMNNLGLSQALSGRLDQGILTLQEALRQSGHAEKIRANLKLLQYSRDVCASCGAAHLRQGGSLILAVGLKGTDQDGPCAPQPTANAIAAQLASPAQAPTIDIRVFFEFDSALLKPEAVETLDVLGEALTHPSLDGYRFEIAGHTDARGGEAYNQSLSERRAQAVLDYLVERFAIAPGRIEVVGYGESRLLDPAHPERDTNRRVQVTRLGRM